MTEDYRGRWEISRIQDYIERLHTGSHPKDRILGGVLEDMYSESYTTLFKNADDTDIGSVMHGILYIALGEGRFEFGTVVFAPNVDDRRLRTTLLDTANSLSSFWSPEQHQTYDTLQELILERNRFRTLFAMTIAQGVNERGSKEIISFSFPNEFREVIELPTKRERDISGLMIAGSFFRGMPFRR